MENIKRKEEQHWTICTDSESSLRAIEGRTSQHPILNEIYDIAAEL